MEMYGIWFVSSKVTLIHMKSGWEKSYWSSNNYINLQSSNGRLCKQSANQQTKDKNDTSNNQASKGKLSFSE